MGQAEISRGKAKRIPSKLSVCLPLEEQGSWKMLVTLFIFKLVVTFVHPQLSQAPGFPIVSTLTSSQLVPSCLCFLCVMSLSGGIPPTDSNVTQ